MNPNLLRTSASAVAIVGALALAACQPSEESKLARGDIPTSEQVPGQARQGPMPGLSPAQPALDDAAITGKVSTALRADPMLGAFEIAVAAEDGVVTLSGNLPDPAKQERAMAIARSVQGVMDVRGDFS